MLGERRCRGHWGTARALELGGCDTQGVTERLLTTAETAARLGMSTARVRQLIERGQLPAIRLGRIYAVREGLVESFRREPIGKRGRPRRVVAILRA